MKSVSRALTCFALTFSNLVVISPADAVTKIGSACKTLNSKSKVNGVTVECLKSGKKLIWQKVVLGKAASASPPTPTPTPEVQEPATLPTSFVDLEVNRKGISRAAWEKASSTIEKDLSKVGTIEIFTGPNTKITFDDYPKVLVLVSKLFPEREVPKKNVVFRYSIQDLEWAEKKVREYLPENDYIQMNRNEGGRLVGSNCDVSRKTCVGSKQQTTADGTNLILQGVPENYDVNDLNGRERLYSGMLEAHEYFHSLQRIPMLNKQPRSEIWPHAWFREGSAEWVQNATVNHKNFKKYASYRGNNCTGACAALSRKDIIRFLEVANGNQQSSEFDPWLDYSLGGLIVEALVSVSSPDSILAMYEEVSRNVEFSVAFRKVFGIEWKEAIPILAGAIYANLQEK